MTNPQKALKTSFLSRDQQKLLSTVIDVIIPASNGSPSASDTDVATHVESSLSTSSATRNLLTSGLQAIEVTSGRAYRKSLADLTYEQRESLLSKIESALPEFFNVLIQQTYSGYYTNSNVLRSKGIHVGAPQPEGFQMEPFQESLLERVRSSGTKYRT